ncbi:hypothetical protein JOQ06_007329, partial [Pogonophryne albipinna]
MRLKDGVLKTLKISLHLLRKPALNPTHWIQRSYFLTHKRAQEHQEVCWKLRAI